jgi:hypothetical protein
VQFDNFVITVQANVAPQLFDLRSSSAFADLGGAPPQARYISVVGCFIVLSGQARLAKRIADSRPDLRKFSRTPR